MIYILLADDANKEGVQALGPFDSHDEADAFADGDGGNWRIVKVDQWYSP